MAMGVSFLSTFPSLLPLVRDPSTTTNAAATRYPSPAAPICCNKIEIDVADEDRFHRRDILKCFGATIGLELIGSSGSFVGMANAADLIQRRQRSEFLSNVKGTFYTAIKGNTDLIPSILTLALNDALTYDKATKSGGPNGSIRFSSEISRPENKGLSAALNLLEEAKKEIDSYSKGGPISFADLIQYAAQSAAKATFLASAIRKCGGNEEKGNLLYTAYGSNGQWSLFDKQFGRTDAQDPDPEGRVPIWEKASVKEMKDKFSAVGFGPRQLAVLSAFLGPDQTATETLLATDPDVSPWVQKYQRSRETVSQTDYEVDLITTLTKDRFLPIANVSRIMKKVLPANAKISKDAKETVQECVSEFISFITNEASDKCQREKRKTICSRRRRPWDSKSTWTPLKICLQRY